MLDKYNEEIRIFSEYLKKSIPSMEAQKKNYKKMWKQRDNENKVQLSLMNNFITFEQISMEYYAYSEEKES